MAKQMTQSDLRIVHMKGDRFIVTYDENGEPSSIKRRILWQPGTYLERWANVPYWHKSHGLGGPRSLPVRILAADAKLREAA